MAEIFQNISQISWGFVFSTLLIRFIGVFIVLAILMAGIQLLGIIVPRLVAWQEARRGQQSKRQDGAAPVHSPEQQTGEEEIAAAIGAAIALSIESAPSMQPVLEKISNNGSWSLAGRMALMSNRLPAGSQRRVS